MTVRAGVPRRLQGRSVVGYLTCAIRAHLLGEPAPSVIRVPSEAN